MDKLYEVLENIVWLTQLGLNMMMPLLLCLWAAWWSVTRWNFPLWVYLPAVLLGIAAGGVNFFRFWQMMEKRAKKSKNRRTGFNQHL